ncbi:MAG TPA: HlyD family secretion protein [Candidatus Bathyarchaeia archaeon]|nr:HlyD family secretion protein [Candidatus Bathyarchaeia archaeon]
MATYTSEIEREDAVQMPEIGGPANATSPKPRRHLLLIGGLAVVAAVALGFYLHSRNRVSTDDAQVDGHIVPIAAKISGSVEQVLVDDNQQVKAGDVLVRIDPRDYQARLDQARAALAIAEAQARGAQVGVPWTSAVMSSGMSSAEAQVATAQAELSRARVDAQQAANADLAYAQANVKSAQANDDKARADLERMKPLVAKAEISQQQYDSYVAAARVAQGQLEAAQQKLLSARDQAQSNEDKVNAAQARLEQSRAALAQAQANRKQVDISTAQSASAAASVQQARANLETAQLLLSYATLAAPVSGVVTKKTVQLGQILQPGQSLMTLVPLQDVWVTANFKETELKNVRVGQRAEVHVDMYGRNFPGRVDSIAGATGTRLSLLPPENATGNYVKVVQRIPVKITLDPLPQGFVLRPGMNVDATIFTR